MTLPQELAAILDACADGGIPPNIALMRLILLADTEAEVAAALRAARPARGGDAGSSRLAAALALWESCPDAFATVKGVAALAPHDAEAATPEAAVSLWREVFDRLATSAPEVGVALYGLGSPGLLAAATAEVVEHLRERALVGAHTRVLEVGCGSGRFVAALAPLVAHVTGLDVSPGMIEVARQRCTALPNVRLATSSGRDLAGVPDGVVDLVLAADVFPYLVAAGQTVVAAHLAEIRRVLAADGALLVLNYSYRGDPDRDRAEIERLLAGEGLALVEAGPSGFALWDAARYLARHS